MKEVTEKREETENTSKAQKLQEKSNTRNKNELIKQKWIYVSLGGKRLLVGFDNKNTRVSKWGLPGSSHVDL